MTRAKRILIYVALALTSYANAAGLGGIALAAKVFVAGGIFFDGYIWMEARRSWRARRTRHHRA